MKKVLMSLLFGAFILTGTSYAQTPPPAPVVVAPVVATGVPHHDHYPEIHKALRKLRAAKTDLERAAHDYGGHKARAIGAIDGAIAELQAALDYAHAH